MPWALLGDSGPEFDRNACVDAACHPKRRVHRFGPGIVLRRSLMPMLQQTTGEVRLADHKRRHQRTGIAVLTGIPTKSRRIPSPTAPNIASAGNPKYHLLTNSGLSWDCRFETLLRVQGPGARPESDDDRTAPRPPQVETTGRYALKD